jgi:ABC-type lipoprotein release transport system permease subunit
VLREAHFKLAGILPIHGAANDPALTPELPGVTDQPTIDQWDPPPQLHFDNKRVKKPDDEQYWDEYRTTPKAYITLERGKELWGSRFGQFTSIRIAPEKGGDLKEVAARFHKRLLELLQPEQGGLVFDPVAQRRFDASTGGTDFGELFLGFSFFLIIAALLLVGLLFRLNLDRRAGEIGLLLAAGYRRRTVRGLLLAEGTILSVLGGLVGGAGAVLYAWLLLEYLRAWWPGGLDRSFLRLHMTPRSFVLGYLASLIISVLTIAWAVRVLGRVAPRALLAGETSEGSERTKRRAPARRHPWISGAAGTLAIVLAICGRFIGDHELQAMTFFGSGTLLLTALLFMLWAWMRGTRHTRVHGQGSLALARLGVRNASRHPARSLMTAGLLAFATFVVVAVQSFHREPGRDFLKKDAGSGGFTLLAETDVPIYQDLNNEQARRFELNFPATSSDTFKDVTFYPFRLRAGDDASCLNLYQPRRPRVLGVPESLIERGGFRLAASEARTNQERANPWLLLKRTETSGEVPVLVDATTAQWTFHRKLGETIEVPDESGQPVSLRIVGLLQDSIFQSEVLVSEANFLRLYPRQEGYQFFLIDAVRSPEWVRSELQAALADRGLSVTLAAERLQSYLAVENTYLSTFQALGGLGLVLGALGLAVVLTRSVWERRGELALLRALGFRQKALGWLVLAENSFLLVVGLAVGTGAALLAVAPHLIGGGGEVPWERLIGLLILVLAVGMTAGAIAVLTTLRAPLLPALRRE